MISATENNIKKKNLNLCAHKTARKRLISHFLFEKNCLQQHFGESLDQLINSKNVMVSFHLINVKS